MSMVWVLLISYVFGQTIPKDQYNILDDISFQRKNARLERRTCRNDSPTYKVKGAWVLSQPL